MNCKTDTITEIKKLFPNVKITMLPALPDGAKGKTNPKKLADMKKILSKVKSHSNLANTNS